MKNPITLSTLFIAFAIVLTSCFNIKPPEVKAFENVKMQGVKDGEISLGIDVRIKNDNNCDLKVTALDLNVTVNDTKLGKAILTEKVVLEKNKEKTYHFPVNIKMEGDQGGLFTLLLGFLGSKPKIELDGSVTAKAYGISKTVPIKYSQK